MLQTVKNKYQSLHEKQSTKGIMKKKTNIKTSLMVRTQ